MSLKLESVITPFILALAMLATRFHHFGSSVNLPDASLAPDIARCDAVLLHSPRAAKALARYLKLHPAPQLRALGLSKAVLTPLSRTLLAQRAFPPMPLEAALLNLIGRRP